MLNLCNIFQPALLPEVLQFQPWLWEGFLFEPSLHPNKTSFQVVPRGVPFSSLHSSVLVQMRFQNGYKKFHLNHWWSGYTTPTEIFTTFHNNQQYQSPIPIKTSWESAKPARNTCSELILENERHKMVSKMSSELLPTSSYLSGKITLNISPHGTYSSMCFFFRGAATSTWVPSCPPPFLSPWLLVKATGKATKNTGWNQWTFGNI